MVEFEVKGPFVAVAISPEEFPKLVYMMLTDRERVEKMIREKAKEKNMPEELFLFLFRNTYGEVLKKTAGRN